MQVEERSKIIDAVEFFGSLGRLHRCLVTRTVNGEIKRSVCSQSDVVRYVAKHIFDTDELKHFASISLEKLGWGNRHPVSISHSSTVLEAINTLIQKKVSCLAVVDEAGALVSITHTHSHTLTHTL